MKNPFLLGFLFLLLFTASAHCQAKAENQLTVTGKAEIFVPADKAAIECLVIGYGSSLRIAVDMAKQKTKEICDKLMKMGLKEKDFSTSNFFSSENFNGKSFLSSSKDYKASINVNLEIDSLKMLEDIILFLSENNVENISNISYTLSHFTDVKSQARIKALDNARKKAEQIAGALKKTLGDVKTCEEINERFGYYGFSAIQQNTINYAEDSNSEGMASGLPGKMISITQAFKITYELK